VLTDQILQRKGREVATVAPDTSVRFALEKLRDANVGALVVSSDGRTVDGIVSERDIVRGLADGPEILDSAVAEIMQAEVLTCTGGDHVDHLMERMTEHRIRHLPVVDDARALVGIISIGDVVKSRVDELETERSQLVDYIRTGR
jgi:CBS domain-containing protein